METQKFEEPPKNKRLKVLMIVLLIAILLTAGILVYFNYFAKNAAQEQPQNVENQAQEEEEEVANCPWEFTDEERMLMEDWQTYLNDRYNFSFKLPREWRAAISNNENMASFADFVFGDDSLAAINLMSIVGDETRNYPVRDLVEKERKSFMVGCQEATYIEYNETRNDRWDMDEHHFRTNFTKDGVPYLMILNFPSQGASADGDTIDAYNLILKTFQFID